MTMSIAEKLKTLGHDLPKPAGAAGNYAPTVRAGRFLHVAGQIAMATDGPPSRRAGAELDLTQAGKAAETACLSLLAQIAAATDGSIAAVSRVVRLGVFVAATPDFTRHPEVANPASDLVVAVFGERGRHARSAVGVASLPRGAAVEIEAVVELME